MQIIWNLLLLIILPVEFFAQQLIPDEEGFYNLYSIQNIDIQFEEKNWDRLLDSFQRNGARYLLGEVKINGLEFKNAGIKYSGNINFSKNLLKKSLDINLSLINADQNFEQIQKLKLTNANRDPSFVREVMGFKIARTYMIAPKANYARVSINDQYYGLMINVEVIDKTFMQNHYKDANGAFFSANPYSGIAEPEGCSSKVYCNLSLESHPKCYLHNYEILSEQGWDKLIKLTEVLNTDISNIENIMDVDSWLWMLAINNTLVNLSSYAGRISENYFICENSYGLFESLIWDLNLAFGSYKNTGTGSDLELKELQNLDPLLHINNYSKPLIKNLLGNDFYKKIYLAHIRRILKDWLSSRKYDQLARSLQQQIIADLERDPNKHYSMIDFQKSFKWTIGEKSKIPGIEQLMTKRTKYLSKHPDLNVKAPSIENLQVSASNAQSKENKNHFRIKVQVSNYTKRVYLYYRFNNKTTYKRMYMTKDDAGNNEISKGVVFTSKIFPEEGSDSIDFYILAENAAVVKFFPENYRHNPVKGSLSELQN